MLPGGRTVLYTLLDEGAFYDNRWDSARIVVQSIEGGKPKVLLEGGSDAKYVPTGHIVYALRGTLLAVPFDLETLSVTGGSVPVIEGVRRSTAQVSGAALYAFSDSGSMVYVPGPISEQEAVFIYDRQGVAKALPLPPGSYRYPRVSPDGSQVAFDSSDNKETFVSVYNLSSTAASRITFGSNNRYPIWSGDGKRVVFQSDREGAPAVFWQEIGSGSAERLTTAEPGTSHVPESGSRDGVLLYSVRKGTAVSLWSLAIADRQPKAFGEVVSHGLPTNAAFSPDDAWVASDRGGGFVRRVDLRAAVPRHRLEARDRPRRPAGLVTRRHRAVPRAGARPVPDGQGDAEADVLVHLRSGASTVRHFRSGDATDFRFPAERPDYRGRSRRARSGRGGAAGRAQLV